MRPSAADPPHARPAGRDPADGCDLAPDEAARRYPRLADLIAYLDSLDRRASLDTLTRLLKGLRVTRDDIGAACRFAERGYRRNTICRSDHYELLANCWRSGHCTPIHDHRGVSCGFLIVEGQGTEIRFDRTPSGLVCPVSTVRMDPGYVCVADEPDIHQVANMQAPGRDLVTLHIYSPPIVQMTTYDYKTSAGADCGEKYD